jgi:glucosamine--fructose-6-phosphate aminotransferase (isomerizing)
MDDLPAPESSVRPPDDRHRHPYHMHEMIRRQPIAARTTLTSVEGLALPKLPADGRVLWTGIGTSFHAALALSRAAGSERAAPLRHSLAVPSFELRSDPPLLDEVTLAVLVSASGQTDVTRRAAALLKARKIPMLLISAAPGGPIAEIADTVVVTQFADESSWAHTVSYSAALVAGNALLAGWSDSPAARFIELESIPDAITAALAYENTLVEVAERWADRNPWILLASGPRSATIREGALKLREAAGRFVATIGVEELLHGPLASVEKGTIVVALTGTSLEAARAREGLAAARDIGAETLLLDSTPGATGPDVWTPSPLVGGISPIVDVIPLQLLAYWMGVSSGRNPDMMGLDDPKHRTARGRFGL